MLRAPICALARRPASARSGPARRDRQRRRPGIAGAGGAAGRSVGYSGEAWLPALVLLVALDVDLLLADLVVEPPLLASVEGQLTGLVVCDQQPALPGTASTVEVAAADCRLRHGTIYHCINAHRPNATLTRAMATRGVLSRAAGLRMRGGDGFGLG
jgi:hypothetical protein